MQFFAANKNAQKNNLFGVFRVRSFPQIEKRNLQKGHSSISIIIANVNNAG